MVESSLWTNWLWIRVPLQSLKFPISCLLQARNPPKYNSLFTQVLAHTGDSTSYSILALHLMKQFCTLHLIRWYTCLNAMGEYFFCMVKLLLTVPKCLTSTCFNSGVIFTKLIILPKFEFVNIKEKCFTLTP